jgi:hypothetical protein
MKRIIDGVTYNTETATRIALKEEKDFGGTRQEEIYVTRGGAFFLVVKYADDDQIRIYPRRRSEVEHWLTDGHIDVFTDILPDPPEATAETTAGATIYVRVPRVLKHRLEAVAEANGQSLNAWVTRCLERCAT